MEEDRHKGTRVTCLAITSATWRRQGNQAKCRNRINTRHVASLDTVRSGGQAGDDDDDALDAWLCEDCSEAQDTDAGAKRSSKQAAFPVRASTSGWPSFITWPSVKGCGPDLSNWASTSLRSASHSLWKGKAINNVLPDKCQKYTTTCSFHVGWNNCSHQLQSTSPHDPFHFSSDH